MPEVREAGECKGEGWGESGRAGGSWGEPRDDDAFAGAWWGDVDMISPRGSSSGSSNAKTQLIADNGDR